MYVPNPTDKFQQNVKKLVQALLHKKANGVIINDNDESYVDLEANDGCWVIDDGVAVSDDRDVMILKNLYEQIDISTKIEDLNKLILFLEKERDAFAMEYFSYHPWRNVLKGIVMGIVIEIVALEPDAITQLGIFEWMTVMGLSMAIGGASGAVLGAVYQEVIINQSDPKYKIIKSLNELIDAINKRTTDLMQSINISNRSYGTRNISSG